MKEKEYIEIVKLHSTPVYRFLYKHFQDVAICEDIVQESFAKLWKCHDKIEFNKAKSWMYTTANRGLIDYIRTIKKFSHLQEDEIYTKQFEDSKDSYQVVHTYIEFLSFRQKSLILLRDIEGYEYQEIADILQIELSSVKVGLFRARKNLKEIIEKNEVWISR